MKNKPEKRVNTERVYWIMLMSPGHPIILLKSNKFDMAAVSIKRSIAAEMFTTRQVKMWVFLDRPLQTNDLKFTDQQLK